jgi:hypothetical protein
MSDNPYIPEITNGVRVYADGQLWYQYDANTCARIVPTSLAGMLYVKHMLRAQLILITRDIDALKDAEDDV